MKVMCSNCYYNDNGECGNGERHTECAASGDCDGWKPLNRYIVFDGSDVCEDVIKTIEGDTAYDAILKEYPSAKPRLWDVVERHRPIELAGYYSIFPWGKSEIPESRYPCVWALPVEMPQNQYPRYEKTPKDDYTTIPF